MGLLSDETVAVQTKRLLIDSMAGMYGMAKANVMNVRNLVFSNPFGLTPQQVMDGFDTNAKILVTFTTTLRTFANDMATDAGKTGELLPALVPAGWSVTLNANGTVTVTAV